MTGNIHNQKRRDFILKLARLSAAVSLCLGTSQAFAGRNSASIKETKIVANQNLIKLQISLDKAAPYKVFSLKSPDRVVVDLLDTTGSINIAKSSNGHLKGIRHASRNDTDLRLVLDLKRPAVIKSTQKGTELEISLNFSAPATTATTPAKQQKAPQKPKAIESKPIAPTRPQRGDFIVAIDPGHGGKDPGAVGARGTYEKDVVLQIGRKLKAQIDRTPGMKAVMVRDGDFYIPLRKRMEIARNNRADLFVSIHADANPQKNLTGSSVYILSENGASSEAARWLASSENSYEQNLGGATLQGKDSTLTSMLMDLSQAATIDNSLNLAKRTLQELQTVNTLLHRNVESAAFVVLKSPDIPSMLVETAFISNPDEENRLRTSSYQSKLANAMFNGIKGYKLTLAPGGRMQNYARNSNAKPNNTQQHVVKPGESLSVIAREYGVPQSSLKAENQLSGSFLQVGQKLSIPTRS